MKQFIARIKQWIEKMTDSRSQREEVLFFVVGIVLSLGVLILFITSISFLASRIDTALDVDTISESTSVEFQLEKLSDLGIGNGGMTQTP